MAYFEKRVTKKGVVRWRCQIRVRGMPPINRTFRTKSRAEQWALQIEADELHPKSKPSVCYEMDEIPPMDAFRRILSLEDGGRVEWLSQVLLEKDKLKHAA